MSMPWILRHPILRLLLGLIFIWAFAFGLTIPFLTLTARDRGVSLDAIGVIAASFLLAQIIFQVPLGALSDRVGRAGPLAAGIALFSVATVGFTQADSAAEFIVLRGEETAEDLMAFVAERVAPYKKVRRLEFVAEIPKSPSGKILRRVLVERERAELLMPA